MPQGVEGPEYSSAPAVPPWRHGAQYQVLSNGSEALRHRSLIGVRRVPLQGPGAVHGEQGVECLTLMDQWAGGRRNDGWIPEHGMEEPGTAREAAPQAEANRLHQPQQAF